MCVLYPEISKLRIFVSKCVEYVAIKGMDGQSQVAVEDLRIWLVGGPLPCPCPNGPHVFHLFPIGPALLPGYLNRPHPHA